MQGMPGWDDLALFAVIARTGTLTAAASRTGTSIATLSRRMKALEARTGRRLFLHGAQGYRLTAEGRALSERAARMERVAAEIARWQQGTDGPACIRISAGTWTARMLAERVTRFWQPDADWLPEFVHCNADMDIARREIDIGIRNRRPEHPWLAGRKTAEVAYAVYGRDPGVTGWIGPSHDAALTPSGRWIARHHAEAIVTRTNEPQLAVSLARAGIGRVVLPTFTGDMLEGLARLSDPIAALQSEEWLVAHHEARHDPPIRAALEALAGFLASEARYAP